jgi:hypothetical protein
VTIRYTTTLRDLLAFVRYHRLHDPFTLFLYALMFAITLWMSVGSVPPDTSAEASVVLVVLMEGEALIVVVALLTLLSVLSLVSRRNKTVLTDHTLTLSDDGLAEQTPFNTTVHKWSAVQKVGRTKKHLFVYVAQHSAHVIPRRAVSTDAEWGALHEFILASTSP